MTLDGVVCLRLASRPSPDESPLASRRSAARRCAIRCCRSSCSDCSPPAEIDVQQQRARGRGRCRDQADAQQARNRRPGKAAQRLVEQRHLLRGAVAANRRREDRDGGGAEHPRHPDQRIDLRRRGRAERDFDAVIGDRLRRTPAKHGIGSAPWSQPVDLCADHAVEEVACLAREIEHAADDLIRSQTHLDAAAVERGLPLRRQRRLRRIVIEPERNRHRRRAILRDHEAGGERTIAILVELDAAPAHEHAGDAVDGRRDRGDPLLEPLPCLGKHCHQPLLRGRAVIRASTSFCQDNTR
ncbi:hypothetical protein [Bradyrhizobium sp. USDA 4529]